MQIDLDPEEIWMLTSALVAEVMYADSPREHLVLDRYDRSAFPAISQLWGKLIRAAQEAEPAGEPGEPHCFYDRTNEGLGKVFRYCQCAHPDWHPVIPDDLWPECARSSDKRTLKVQVTECTSGEEFVQKVAEATGMD